MKKYFFKSKEVPTRPASSSNCAPILGATAIVVAGIGCLGAGVFVANGSSMLLPGLLIGLGSALLMIGLLMLKNLCGFKNLPGQEMGMGGGHSVAPNLVLNGFR